MTSNSNVTPVTGLTIRRCTKYVGAEITGIDLAKPLDRAAVEAIASALAAHGVVFFRAQNLTEAQHIAFSRSFDELEIFVLTQYTNPSYPEILILSNIVNEGKPVGLADAGTHWHSDTSYLREPDRASILSAREIPAPHSNGETAGDTMFASAQAAYEALEPSMQNKLLTLRAVYSYTYFHANKLKQGAKRAPLTEEQKRRAPDVTHPVIRTHPLTGRKSIYVNPNHTVRIDGMSDSESEGLLDFLYAHITKPEFIYRHKWKVGDVLMWDNCIVQHKAIADYSLPQRRLMHRTTLKGAAPF